MNLKKTLGIGALVLGLASAPAISKAEDGEAVESTTYSSKTSKVKKKFACKLKQGCTVEYDPNSFLITGKTSKGKVELYHYQYEFLDGKVLDYLTLTFNYKNEVTIWYDNLDGKVDQIRNETYGECYGGSTILDPVCPKKQLKNAKSILDKYKKKMNYKTALMQLENAQEEPNYLEGIE